MPKRNSLSKLRRVTRFSDARQAILTEHLYLTENGWLKELAYVNAAGTHRIILLTNRILPKKFRKRRKNHEVDVNRERFFTAKFQKFSI